MTPVYHDGPLAALIWDGASPVVWRTPDRGAGERHGLAQALVATLAGVAADGVRLARNPAGAPRVASPPGWYIGLSQRGGYGVIAVANRPIAVDRECVDDAPPLWDMLSTREAQDLRALAPSARPRGWLRRWTIKEAHAKLIGEPRRLAPEAIETHVLDTVHATATCEGVSQCWTRERDDAIETVALWADPA